MSIREDAADKILVDLTSALDQFGTYSFDDKGMHEVMDSPAADLLAMDGSEAGGVLFLVLEASDRPDKVKERAEALVVDILSELDGSASDEWWAACMAAAPSVAKVY